LPNNTRSLKKKILRKLLQKRFWSEYSKSSRASTIYLQIFMQNGKVGEGDIFSKENVLIALFALKFRNSSSIITSISTESRMKVRQHIRVRSYHLPQCH
jgi:hypothetical protein